MGNPSEFSLKDVYGLSMNPLVVSCVCGCTYEESICAQVSGIEVDHTRHGRVDFMYT